MATRTYDAGNGKDHLRMVVTSVAKRVHDIRTVPGSDGFASPHEKGPVVGSLEYMKNKKMLILNIGEGQSPERVEAMKALGNAFIRDNPNLVKWLDMKAPDSANLVVMSFPERDLSAPPEKQIKYTKPAFMTRSDLEKATTSENMIFSPESSIPEPAKGKIAVDCDYHDKTAPKKEESDPLPPTVTLLPREANDYRSNVLASINNENVPHVNLNIDTRALDKGSRHVMVPDSCWKNGFRKASVEISVLSDGKAPRIDYLDLSQFTGSALKLDFHAPEGVSTLKQTLTSLQTLKRKEINYDFSDVLDDISRRASSDKNGSREQWYFRDLKEILEGNLTDKDTPSLFSRGATPQQKTMPVEKFMEVYDMAVDSVRGKRKEADGPSM